MFPTYRGYTVYGLITVYGTYNCIWYRCDKEIAILSEDFKDVKSQLDISNKAKVTAEKSCRHLEDRLAETVAKV